MPKGRGEQREGGTGFCFPPGAEGPEKGSANL